MDICVGSIPAGSWREACQYRIDFRWLLEDQKAPDHTTFARFRTGRCREVVEDLFYQFVKKLEDMGETEHKTVYIDGTKLESAAAGTPLCGANPSKSTWQR